MIYGALILVVAGVLFWRAYRHPRPRRWLLPSRALPRAIAAVDRQHRHLQAGGLLGESACEKTKTHFRELLESGRADLVERELHAGLDFAVRVRALTDLGTPAAARLLERQLTRELTPDPVERAWYWVDVASALRRLNYAEALPAVLHCAEATSNSTQGAVLASEAVCFTNFPAVLRHPNRTLSRRALQALTTATRATRTGGVEAPALIQAGLGDILADLTSRADLCADPWLTSALIEAERYFRRLGHWARFVPPDVRALAARQEVRLGGTSEHRLNWLGGASPRLLARFASADTDEQGVALRCLFELRADVTKLFPHLPDRHAPWWADAIRALQWSRSSVVGPVLAGQAAHYSRKARHHGRAAVVLTALRGHACYEAERVLLRTATATNPALRNAAIGSLGWWAPFDPNNVVGALRAARTDSDTETRRAAVSALARLGERSALAEITTGLDSEEPAIRQDAAARIAAEELSWAWPDLETAAESSDPDTALAATEALESLRERLFGFAR